MNRLTLPQSGSQSARRAVRTAVQGHELDAVLITSPSNIRWLTGFTGSSALVVVHGSSITLFTDARYAERAPAELADVGSTAGVCIERERLGAAVRDCLGD